MSDWQKGDLALCVVGGCLNAEHFGHDDFPQKGQIYTVSYCDNALFGGKFINPCLWLVDGPRNTDGTRAWWAYRFRKIRPSAIKHIEALKDVPLHVRENEHA